MKKIVIASIVAVILAVAGGVASMQSKPVVEETKEAVKAAPKETPAVPPTESVPVTSNPVATTNQLAPVVPATVLSSDEYATKYLNMTDVLGQDAWKCFHNIVTLWPDRFTPDVRENNIKALQLWNDGGICSTGMGDLKVRMMVTLPIRSFGLSGEYFDSQMAKDFWD